MEPVIIIPTLNPDHRLINLVEKLKEGNIPIVIINDGSKEECSDIFQKLKARFQCDILNHAKNIGKGAAIKTGIGYVSKVYPKNCGFITADGDGQHAAEDILKVAEALEENHNSLILGSREFSKRDVPFKSKWGNRITSLVFKLSTGLYLYTAGYLYTTEINNQCYNRIGSIINRNINRTSVKVGGYYYGQFLRS